VFEGADDFIIPDQSYWNITAVSWIGFFHLPDEPLTSWVLNVYSDGGFDFNTFSNRNSQPRFV
jgi:hypothetical protein